MKEDNFLLNALDKAAISIAILDSQLKIKWVNDIFEEWNQQTDYINKDFLEVTSHPQLAKSAIQQLLSSHEKEQVFQVYNLKGRSTRTTISCLSTLQNAFVVTQVNVTNLVKAHHYQKVFSSSMGHETKGHLRRCLELLNDLYRKHINNPNLQENLGALSFYMEHAFDIVKNLNDWGKPLLGNESPIAYSPFILEEQIALVKSRYELMLRHNQIQLITDYPNDFQFRAEPEMFRAVLRNLVSNSIDAIIQQQKEHGKIGGTIEIVAAKIDNKVILKVSDDGGGIPEKDRESLFVTVEAESFSLGTVLCKEFILAHHGNIFIDIPKENYDTTITIIIPKKL